MTTQQLREEIRKALNNKIIYDYLALDTFKSDIERSVRLYDYEETEQIIKRMDLLTTRIDTLKEILYMIGE